MRRKRTTWGFEAIFWVCLVLLLPSSALAQAPPVDDCLAYAYTSSENHHFLILNNSSVFGQEVQIVHNCEELTLRVDGVFAASSSTDFNYQIEQGIHNITLEGGNFSQNFENVNFYPERLDWEFQYVEGINQGEAYILISESQFQINYAVAFSIVIVWVLSVFVYWQLINSYVERTFIEEVQQ